MEARTLVARAKKENKRTRLGFVSANAYARSFESSLNGRLLAYWSPHKVCEGWVHLYRGNKKIWDCNETFFGIHFTVHSQQTKPRKRAKAEAPAK